MTILNTFDATANDSDKSFVVPDGRQWEILWVHVLLATTASVGGRQIALEIQDDSSNVVMDQHAGATVPASTTNHIEMAQGVFRETSFVAGAIHMPIPKDLILLPGWALRVFDSATIDAAADDMTVSFMYKEMLERIEL